MSASGGVLDVPTVLGDLHDGIAQAAATSALGAPAALGSAAAALATFGAVTDAADRSRAAVAVAVAAGLDGGVSGPTSRRPRR